VSGAVSPSKGPGAAVSPIAVIGMAGRFPGAADVEAFWSNLRQGVPGIRFFTDDELDAAGVSPERRADPAFVAAGGVLDGIDRFDAEFFGYSPREASAMDPQQRLLLETAWEALENAGYAPGDPRVTVGVYAGAGNSYYLEAHVRPRADVVAAVGPFQVGLSNGRDFVAARVAHRLDLHGPAMTIATACSTGLTTVHVACQALAAGECDVAVAGGVSVSVFQDQGYHYAPGGIASPDGYCRVFDAQASGTVDGNGVALVVLKPLADALADGDTIRAVILGTALNNDGARKVGFTAPSVDGQAAAIEEALAVAGVQPDDIGFVEAHGTGTELGDPVEVAALVQAFGRTRRTAYCALGAVKASIGHLDSAAGAAGLVKAVLAVERGEIPPTLNFTAPNPRIGLESSPFFVNGALLPWPADAGRPRRAGVSAFGLGGTNVHAVVQQPPAQAPSAPARQWQLLPLSARTPAALAAAAERLAAHLRGHPEQSLADAAYTLQVGRRAFSHRRAVVARGGADAAEALERRAPETAGVAPDAPPRVALLLPGTASRYAGMGRGLYDAEPVYREAVDRCAAFLRPLIGADLREVLYPADGAAARMEETGMAELAVFVTGWAAARLWMHWGVRPAALLGHSLGEYVAATLAGVWSLEDGLAIVAERARLLDAQPAGAMLAVALGEAEVRPLLRDGLCVASVDGPAETVVSGPEAAVEALRGELEARGVVCRRLALRHALHSPALRPAAAALAERIRGVRLSAPSIPFVSGITGEWIRDDEATDPGYWARHLCLPVRFADGVRTLMEDGRPVLLEAGAGDGLRSLVFRLPQWNGEPPLAVTSIPNPGDARADGAHVMESAGRLWTAGVEIDWLAMHRDERLRRIPLPTYPFQRRRHWLDRLPVDAAPPAAPADAAEWLHVPSWTRAPLAPSAVPEPPSEWLVLADDGGIGARLAGRLEERGHTVAVAYAGDGFARCGDRGYTVRPGSADDLRALAGALDGAGVRRIVHLWGIGEDDDGAGDVLASAHARGPATLAALADAFAAGDGAPALRLVVVTDHARDVAGGEPVRPERAAVLGAALALPREHPGVACRTVDVHLPADGADSLVRRLVAEVGVECADDVALRGSLRSVRGWQRLRVPAAPRPGGAWAFCGSSAPAAALAQALAGETGARIALVAGPASAVDQDGDEDDARLTALAASIRAAGGEVMLVRAAGDDAVALGAALAQAGEAFGRLDGVIHGMRGADAYVDEADALARVAAELAVLDGAAAAAGAERVVLWMGGGSVTGEDGGARCAAAAFAEAWVRGRAARGGEGWSCVAWDERPAAPFRPADALRAFAALAALAGEPHVVVSPESPAMHVEPVRAAAVLPAADPDDGDADPPGPLAETEAPANPAEELLAGVWCELLGVRRVGVHDDFFRLGGHSLLGLQLIARIREAFQVELPLSDLFLAPTIAALARRIDEAILNELEAMSDDEAMEWMSGGAA
jgi:phthiocerol/phenolphthiocerol synthesis type-I polyketide synthase E